MAIIDYLAVQLTCAEDFRDILVAELSQLEYDSMMETENGLEAYIDRELFNEAELKDLLNKYHMQNIQYEVQEVVSRNWNEEWEKNYDPICVDDQIYVRATFHEPRAGFQYEIVINPRMSFGTGHHSTTYLMLKNQLNIDHEHKRVLDAGTGTGILAVMAEKLGANDILAYDNNGWSTENAPENLKLNRCNAISIQEGTIDTINISGLYEIILANINKNVLLDEIPTYSRFLEPSGYLLLSGFYEHDAQDIVQKAKKNGLKEKSRNKKNDWCSIVFTKSA
ncbi:MAG: 50S ribosomal protein L11 methyltransferase [Bacteroidota bacterium]